MARADQPSSRVGPSTGALVVSLDFELHWGVRDFTPVDGPYAANLRGARTVIPRLLRVFEEYEVAATWATVGFLFAGDRAAIDETRPAVQPAYVDGRLDPYRETLGQTEEEDPLHYGAGLLDVVRASPRQEVGSQTYSHYYCLEAGQTSEAFDADLRSAVQIATASGDALTSLVFPRNQANHEYFPLLQRHGFTAYRGPQHGRVYRPRLGRRGGGYRFQVARTADAYVPLAPDGTFGWDEIRDETGLCNVRASRFLRPWSPATQRLEPLRMRRITRDLERAARDRRLFHLWWHPHNFGTNQEQNLGVLRTILDRFAELRTRHGMQSLSMRDVAAAVGAGASSPHA